MPTRPLRQVLRSLRQIVAPAEGSRLDAELIERFVASGDGAAFARLVERHGPLVLGVCRRVLRNHHDAEDAFQATFLLLARKAPHIRRRDALAGWLYKVAFRLSMKLRASAARRRRAERQALSARRQSADDRITWGELRMVLDEELNRLPRKYRAPLLLCCLAGRTRDEAAEQLGCTLGTLKMRLERGRRLLRTRLARRGLTLSAALLAMMLAQHATATPAPAVLVATTIKTALLFAAGKATAALSAQAVSLAGLGFSADAGKGKLLGPAVVLLVLAGLAAAVLAFPGALELPDPVTDLMAADGATPPVPHGFVDATDKTGLRAIRGTGDGPFESADDRRGLPDFAPGDADGGPCFGGVNRDGRVADHHGLRVRLVGRPGNAGATGARVRLYEAGRPDRLLAYEQVAVGARQGVPGSDAARQTERHFGLGERLAVDVSVEFYPSGRRVEQKNVPADGTVVIVEESP